VNGQTGQIATVLKINKEYEHDEGGYAKKQVSRKDPTTKILYPQNLFVIAQGLYSKLGLGASALYSLAEIRIMSVEVLNIGESLKKFSQKTFFRTISCMNSALGKETSLFNCIGQNNTVMPSRMQECLELCPPNEQAIRFFKLNKLEQKNNIEITIPTEGPPQTSTITKNISGYSECFPLSGNCGEGRKHVARGCFRRDGRPLLPTACEINSYILSIPCNISCEESRSLEIISWSQWSACSRSCGFGTRSRTKLACKLLLPINH
jgi:hypothetical protein